ncbi:MAG: DNA primase [Desulfitobacteriia bacterium]
MARKIPEHFIEEVRQQADIVQIISEYVVLKRTGKNYQGLCPFHTEKTPSFSVNPERQMFYCFGCRTGGNVFTFLMKKENLTFLEAVKTVADRTGLIFPERELSPAEKKLERQRKRFREIHSLAADYFRDVLLNRPEGKPGLQYLKQRGIDIELINTFNLGFAPAKWDGLLLEASTKGVTPQELVEFGLAVGKKNEQGDTNYYDRFRGRLMFTICDLRGVPVAFGGRVLDDSHPKYLNSPETKFFNKGHNLYGLDLAYRGIREKGFALLLEGYMDTIAVHKAGYKNSVASLGTAFTREQAKRLKRYTNRVIIGYDSDQAGVLATLRAGKILMEEGFRVEVLDLGEAGDPDEFLKQYSVEEFQERLQNPSTLIEFKYQYLIQNNPPRTIQDKGELVRSLAPDILKISSSVEREGYERFLSLQLGLTLEAVQSEIHSIDQRKTGKKSFSQKNFKRQDIYVKNRNNISGKEFDYTLDTYVPLGVFRAEQIILRLVLENPEYKSIVKANLENDFWCLEEHRYIFENYSAQAVTHLGNDDSRYEKIQERLAEIYEVEIDFSQAETVLKDCIAALKRAEEEKTIGDLQAEMINMEKSGDMAGALRLLREIGERLKRGEK